MFLAEVRQFDAVTHRIKLEIEFSDFLTQKEKTEYLKKVERFERDFRFLLAKLSDTLAARKYSRGEKK